MSPSSTSGGVLGMGRNVWGLPLLRIKKKYDTPLEAIEDSEESSYVLWDEQNKIFASLEPITKKGVKVEESDD